jgi:hypothetical protein
MSLDLEIKSELSITFILSTSDGYNVNISYPYDKLKTLGCNLCTNLTNEKFQFQDTFDLSDFRYENFSILMKYLETKKLPILNKDLDIKNLHQLALFLGLDDIIIAHLNFESESRFFNSLTPLDQTLVSDEFKLRELLFQNEETDFRDLDSNYEINKVVGDLKLPEIKENEKGKHNKIIKIGEYYGIGNSLTVYDYTLYPMITYIKDNIKSSKKIGLDIFKILGARINEVIYISVILNVLKTLKYKNYVVAGGFIYQKSQYGGTTSNSTDIDIFLITKDYNTAIAEITEIYNTVIKINSAIPAQNKDVLISINGNAINFLIELADPNVGNSTFFINVQVILRLYNSIAQVISGFDIDSCTIAFNGKNFYAMPRFIRSLVLGYNIADPERQSTSYPQRLYKFLNRGINIAFPGINPNYITCNFMDNYTLYNGIAKILTYINTTNTYLNAFKQNVLSDYQISPYILNVEGLYKTIRKSVKDHFYKKYLKDNAENNELQDQYKALIAYYFDSHDVADAFNINGINKKLFQYLKDNNIEIPVKMSYNLEYILDSGKHKSSGLPEYMVFKKFLT